MYKKKPDLFEPDNILFTMIKSAFSFLNWGGGRENLLRTRFFMGIHLNQVIANGKSTNPNTVQGILVK